MTTVAREVRRLRRASGRDMGVPERPLWNKRIAQKTRADSWASRLRVWESKGGGPGASLLLECGCCDGMLKVSFHEHGLERGGVAADWDESLDLFWLLRKKVCRSLRLYRAAVRGHRSAMRRQIVEKGRIGK